MRQTYGFSHRAENEINSFIGLLFSLETQIDNYRGVAQLIARPVWDREVEGLSPFTPTMNEFSVIEEPLPGFL